MMVLEGTLASYPRHREINKGGVLLRQSLQLTLWRCKGGPASGLPRPDDTLPEIIDTLDDEGLKMYIVMNGYGFSDCVSKADYIARAKESAAAAASRKAQATDEHVEEEKKEALPVVLTPRAKPSSSKPARPLGSSPECDLWLPDNCVQCDAPMTDADGNPGLMTWCCGHSICDGCGKGFAKKGKKPLKACQFCGAKPHPAFMSARQVIESLKALAERGSARGQAALAIKHRDGADGLHEDPMEAARLLQLAVDQGSTGACVRLADLLLGVGGEYSSFANTGYQGVPLDDEGGVRLMALAAEAGHPLAQYNVGFMLDRGTNGLKKNTLEAMKWFALASEGGNLLAKKDFAVNLALLKSRGELPKKFMQTFARCPRPTAFSVMRARSGNENTPPQPALVETFDGC